MDVYLWGDSKVTGKGMTPAFLKWRAKELVRRIAEGKGHDTVEYHNKNKALWTENDDKRKRVA